MFHSFYHHETPLSNFALKKFFFKSENRQIYSKALDIHLLTWRKWMAIKNSREKGELKVFSFFFLPNSYMKELLDIHSGKIIAIIIFDGMGGAKWEAEQRTGMEQEAGSLTVDR